MKKLEPCSVLICIYEGDNPSYFEASLKSILEQTLPPDEIIIVVNGAIPDSLETILKKWRSKNRTIKVIRLAKNCGVGEASNHGIKACKNELIAKMDADDIALPKRLEKQVAEFSKRSDLVLLGGQLAEFENDEPNRIVSYRRVPTSLEKIKKFAKQRDPFNNQTVMFKKTVALAVGGYPKLNRAEDYYLYAKIIAEGYAVDNLSDVLVKYRLNPDTLKRRKSWQNTKEMIGARNEIRKLGIMSGGYFIIGTLAQLLLFIMPIRFTKWFYKRMRKNG